MTRFAWLQSRTQTFAVAGALAALAVILAITGAQLSHLYSSLLGHCTGDCGLAQSEFASHDQFIDRGLTIIAQLTPALLGVFWGAPLLSREFDSGTYRLVWTQSVSRSRWLITKLVMGALATVTVAGVVTLAITWWERDFDKISANQYSLFDIRDIAPIGFALFAFAVGALAGAVIRRTVPAMVATLGVYVGVRLMTEAWLRPHLFPALRLVSSLTKVQGSGFISSNGGPVDLIAGNPNLPNAWIMSSRVVTTTGQPTTFAERTAALRHYCPSVLNVSGPPAGSPNHAVAAPGGPFRSCLAHVSQQFNVLTTYQPAHRYWAFQWTEAGIFLALALLAGILCYLWVVRRI